MSPTINPHAEWLETDGLGGFAMGTVGGHRTRRYHGLLVTATTPPTGRVMLVNGFDAEVVLGDLIVPLTSQYYAPDIIAPAPTAPLIRFQMSPWPSWCWELPDGRELGLMLSMAHGHSATVLSWALKGQGASPAVLRLRPFFSGRDYHHLHHENPVFNFTPNIGDQHWTWQPYPGIPAIHVLANATYHHEPQWYRQFFYAEEHRRGLDDTEDCAMPGTFEWDLTVDRAAWIVSAESPSRLGVNGSALQAAQELLESKLSTNPRAIELLKQIGNDLSSAKLPAFPEELFQHHDSMVREIDLTMRSARQFLVCGERGLTLIAGYPWFTDWGRDTFIALRGLCLAIGDVQSAAEILTNWADHVHEGLLPNRFPDGNSPAEYNTVDAALWFCIAAHELLEQLDRLRVDERAKVAIRLRDAVRAIIDGYARGTKYQIHLDTDGLISAGEPGVQLTWMDAKVGDWVVTPRIGKPVEIQALWLNVLGAFGDLHPKAASWRAKGLETFRQRFWNEDRGCLYDVIDVDHQSGVNDASIRPNQIFAVGGLPEMLLEPDMASRVVSTVEEELHVPLGLRTLSPHDPLYRGHYCGGVLDRDGAYHQGTAWPWLLGPFVEAWVRVHGSNAFARRQARERFLPPLMAHQQTAGLGHISEVVDGDPPHTPGGCPFQAWSLGEYLRLDRQILKP